MLSEDQITRLRTCLRETAGDDDHLTCQQAAHIATQASLPLREVECFALESGIIPERYDRNIGTLGLDGQRKLLGSRAAVAGLGGLGGHVVETLARAGVGHIIGIDGDAFVDSNLNRQILARVDNLGAAKTEQAGLRLGKVNPAVEFTPHHGTFDSLDDETFAACDLVFDCVDSIDARRELVKRCARAETTLIHAAISGWSGQVAICEPGSDLIDKIYATATHGTEKRQGNLPFTAAVAANLMVARAVPLLLGWPPPSSRQVQLFDLLDGDWETVDL